MGGLDVEVRARCRSSSVSGVGPGAEPGRVALDVVGGAAVVPGEVDDRLADHVVRVAGVRSRPVEAEDARHGVRARAARTRGSGSRRSWTWVAGKVRTPRWRSGPNGWSRNSNAVAIPKFQPAPRRPQKSSGSSVSVARTSRPSAVTSSTAARLSIVSPKWRWRRPTPPPSVSPATPVWPTTPIGQTRPCACAATSSSPRSAPPFARAVRVRGSTSTPRIADMSTRSPPFAPPSPAALWPPDRTAISRSCSRAKRIAVATSSALDGRAMTAGRRSWIAFQRRRAVVVARVVGRDHLGARSAQLIEVVGRDPCGCLDHQLPPRAGSTRLAGRPRERSLMGRRT